MYRYGEEISYNFSLLEAEDYSNLQLFSCENEQLDFHIKNEIVQKGTIVSEDGLYFKFVEKSTNRIIAVFSLATSGILTEVSPYRKILPAIKIDVLAVDKEFQKLHYNSYSENAENHDEHYYFSDEILGNILRHCNELTEKYALAKYIVVYSDKAAYRYYERNNFHNFTEYMIKDKTMETDENIPMYLDLYE